MYLQESLKKFRSDYEKLEQSDALKKAREKFVSTSYGAVFISTSDLYSIFYVNNFLKLVQKTLRKICNQK